MPSSSVVDSTMKKGTKGKIEIKKRETKQQRAVTCSKRRQTVFFKAADLCLLSGANIAVFATSPSESYDVVYSFSGYSPAYEIADCYLNEKPPPKIVHPQSKLGFWWEDPNLYHSCEDLSELNIIEDRIQRMKKHLKDIAMVSVEKLRRRTRRSTKNSAEKTPDRVHSSPIPPISSPIQPNFVSRPPIHPLPQFDFTDAHYSPFALTNGDNPGNTLVSEVLDVSNFSSWKIAMFVALDAKNKIAFVDGTLPRPPEFDPSFRVWSRCNSMVKSWILNSVTKQIYKSILRFNDAAEIWKDLITRFHITNLPRSYHLTQQIWGLQQGSMSLSEYYTSLKTLWDDLDGASCVDTCQNCKCCVATASKADHAKIVKFLAGLNESYATIRSQIIMKKTIPDLAEIYNLLDQDHSQRSMVTVTNASAFQVAASTSAQFAVNATRSYPPKVPKVQCTHCGYTGHTTDTCYKIHGYPLDFKHKQKNVTPPGKSKPVVANLALTDGNTTNTKGIGPDGIAELVGNMSKTQIQDVIAYFSTQLHNPAQPITIASVASTSNNDGSAFNGISFSPSTLWLLCVLTTSRKMLTVNTWIIDSGATHHVSFDRNLFESLSDDLSSEVTLPTGSNVKIAGVGIIKLNEYITLYNVLYIPQFRLNLLSVSQLTKVLKSKVYFDEGCCVIQDPIKEQKIGEGKQIGGLYVLSTSPAECSSLDNSSSVSVNANCNAIVDNALWHSRLGHPSFEKIDVLHNVLGLRKGNKNEIVHCAVCQQAKQKRLTFPSKNNMSEHAFDLVHIDTWGPFATPTVEGFRYFLTIVDDYSRATWVYLMKAKNEVLTLFPGFLTMVETQYQIHVKAVRSDNAPELKFESLYRDKGIISYHSCPETPQQNSVVERKHQHILNVARALMFQSCIPLEFWGDCILSAVFLINRLPSVLLSNKSPFELLHNKVPDYSLLKVFGCLCYQSTSTHQRHKFESRARACVFLGYPAGYKGYKLLDLETNSIHVSRHVVFFEAIYPFADKKHIPQDIFEESVSTVSETIAPHVISEESLSVENKTVDSVPSSNETVDIGSKRKSRPPGYLQEYYCNAVPDVQKDVRYPISAYINYAQLSEEFTAYICAVNKYPEPCTYAQAKKIKEWLDAMEIEIEALESTNTWSVCSLPDGKKPIGCKWVFKVKLNADGSLERFKARLVAKGYTQKEGEDYGDTFSPVAKMTTVKTLLSVAAAKEWSLHQLDISNAFLNGDLNEEIYISLPPGYSMKQGGILPQNAVLKLQKSLYGLKQASRQWYLKFSSTLMNLGFKKLHADHTLFTRISGNIYTALLVYVDDIVIAGNNDVAIEELKTDLAKAFKLRDLGPLKYFLGLEIARSKKGISVCQRKYTLELLQETGLLGCRPSTIPMEPSVKLALHSDEPELQNPEVYRRLIGKLMYLTITRPDITYAVNRLCQFSSAPKASHLKAAYKVIHYLKGTIGLGLFYSATSDLCLKAYTDADWNSCKDSRRSTSGYCMFLGNSLISWKSRKQDVCSASSAESEYRAMAMGSKEIAWLVKLLNEFQVPQNKPVPLFCDSTAAIHIANNSVFHERTKHVENDCHITRDRIDQGLLKTLHVQTTNQIADALTKPLYPALFQSLIGKMSLLSIYVSS
ncbi:Integrase catalytic core [Arabidopsis thaliana x Arabidopsis arenosa]|uniref:Integrase catalytic core n=1 Tax=Arabidopsis thaliana x Arabidopsis arenosa TaxID=1240361 RepID=A0A8T1Z1N4_9BRAS|nr:Integrase catalytic core [Arabidopsis thaliana x Arabidopsis arenosa]